MARDCAVVGGPQGPKEVLDAMCVAVRKGDLSAALRLKAEFLRVPENAHKCVDSCGNGLTHMAVQRNPAMLEFVLDELLVDPCAVNIHGRTPLHEAVKNNWVESSELLLRHGADDAAVSSTLSTPFHTAAICGSMECLKLLMDRAPDKEKKANETDKSKSTALHKCAYEGELRVCQWLVGQGATVDARNSSGDTPLIVAVRNGRADLVRFFLSEGADCNKADNHGNRCVHLCAARNHLEILTILLAAGAHVNVLNDKFNNPLHLVAMYNQTYHHDLEQFVPALIAAGCDAEQANAAGKKPADYVQRSQRHLFSKSAVDRQEEKAALLRTKDAGKKSALNTMISELMEEEKLHLQKKAEHAKIEDGRINRESEDRTRAERDAHDQFEMMIDRRRLIEEENRQAKEAKNSAMNPKKV